MRILLYSLMITTGFIFTVHAEETMDENEETEDYTFQHIEGDWDQSGLSDFNSNSAGWTPEDGSTDIQIPFMVGTVPYDESSEISGGGMGISGDDDEEAEEGEEEITIENGGGFSNNTDEGGGFETDYQQNRFEFTGEESDD